MTIHSEWISHSQTLAVQRIVSKFWPSICVVGAPSVIRQVWSPDTSSSRYGATKSDLSLRATYPFLESLEFRALSDYARNICRWATFRSGVFNLCDLWLKKPLTSGLVYYFPSIMICFMGVFVYNGTVHPPGWPTLKTVHLRPNFSHLQGCVQDWRLQIGFHLCYFLFPFFWS